MSEVSVCHPLEFAGFQFTIYISIKKKIIKAFKLLGFKIQIASNLKIVDFLDITLNLNYGTFKPFSKNDSAPTYINISSNHPRSVLRHPQCGEPKN